MADRLKLQLNSQIVIINGESMNRIIKFRVWNKRRNAWIHSPHERPDLDGVNLFGETILLGGFMDTVGIDELNDCVPLQYTGVNDMHGKEIFEGDVVECNDGLQGRIYGVVKYDNDYGAFRIVFTDIFQWTFYKIEMPEIIGNIFENPELLK